uniref:Uncharacterized protein n=1 Tax=Arundo donax TaxID=35708 RepID=A0A0A9CSV4_ARUDO
MQKAMMHPETMMRSKMMSSNSLMMRRRLSTKGHYVKLKGRLIDSMSPINLVIRGDHSPEVLDFGRTCHQGTGMHKRQVTNPSLAFSAQIWLPQLLKIRYTHWGLKTFL